jgi:hypothetical protein
MINLGAVARTRGRKGGLHVEYLITFPVMEWLGKEANGFCTPFGRIIELVTFYSKEMPESPRVAAEAKRFIEDVRKDLFQLSQMPDLQKSEIYFVPACITAFGRKEMFTHLHEQVHAKFAQIRNRSNGRMDTERMIYMGLMRTLGLEQGREIIPQLVDLSIERGWSHKDRPRHLEEAMAYGQQVIQYMKTLNYQKGQAAKRKNAAESGLSPEEIERIPYDQKDLNRAKRRVRFDAGLSRVMQKIQDRFGNVYRFAEWMENNITPEMVAAFTPQLVWAPSIKAK